MLIKLCERAEFAVCYGDLRVQVVLPLARCLSGCEVRGGEREGEGTRREKGGKRKEAVVVVWSWLLVSSGGLGPLLLLKTIARCGPVAVGSSVLL